MTKAKEFFKRIVAGLLSFSMVLSLFEGMDIVLPTSVNDAGAVEENPALKPNDGGDTWNKDESGHRIFWRYENTTFCGVPCNNQFFVYAKAGDTIAVGSNVYNSVYNESGTATGSTYGQYDIAIIDLEGKYHTFDVEKTPGSQGLISDPDYEYLAKNMTSKEGMTGTFYNVPNSVIAANNVNDDKNINGEKTYKPFTYTVTETGVYTVEFRGGSTANTNSVDQSSTVGQPANSGTLSALLQPKDGDYKDSIPEGDTTLALFYWYNPKTGYHKGKKLDEDTYVVMKFDNVNNFAYYKINGENYTRVTGLNSSTAATDSHSNRTILKNVLWSQSFTKEVSAFDLSVFDSNDKRVTGRVYLNSLAWQTTGNIAEQFYILTNDNYVYNLRFNGITPYTFSFFSNNRGIVDSANGNIVYKSVKYLINDLNSFAKMGIEYRLPSANDTDLSKTFKIFLEKPNADLEGVLYDKAVLPDPATDLAFSGDKIYEGAGGYFTFNVQEATTATVHIKFDNDTYTSIDIADVVTPYASNSFFWDGKDGKGIKVAAGTKISYSVTTRAGEIHIPMGDMEGSQEGITLERVNNIFDRHDGMKLVTTGETIYDKTKNVVYYDDTAIYYGENPATTGYSERRVTNANNNINASSIFDNPPNSNYNLQKDANGAEFFPYDNYKNFEKNLYDSYGKGAELRVGDHSHISNMIDYFNTETNKSEMIEYLDSSINPVATSKSTSWTTTDYGIANYWTFVPAKSTDVETLDINEEQENTFTLRAFTFFDEKSSSTDGLYKPMTNGDHALPDATFNLYKKVTSSGDIKPDGKYYIQGSDSMVIEPDAESKFSSTDIFELVASAKSTSTGDYMFTGLPYDPESGTIYILETIPPNEGYRLTSEGVTGNPDNTASTEQKASYTLYLPTKTNGAKLQKFTVGGTGLSPKDLDEHYNTVTVTDIGFNYVPSRMLTISKTWDLKKDGAESQRPEYVALELSYATRNDNKIGVYSTHIISTIEGNKYTSSYLPEQLTIDEKSETIDDYYVSAEYYIYKKDGKEIAYRHTFDYNSITKDYDTLLSKDYYCVIEENCLKNGEKLTDANNDKIITSADLPSDPDTKNIYWDQLNWKNALSAGSADTGVDDSSIAPYVCTLNRQKTSSANAEIIINVTNSDVAGTILIHKIDEDKEQPLAGATFALYEMTKDDVENAVNNGTPLTYIAEGTTKANGECVFTGLDTEKTYTVRELYSPSGYLITQPYIEVKGSDLAGGKIKELTVRNGIAREDLIIRKQLRGRAWNSGDKFTFDITAGEFEINSICTDNETIKAQQDKLINDFKESVNKTDLTIDNNSAQYGDTDYDSKCISTNLPKDSLKGWSKDLPDFPLPGTYHFTIKETIPESITNHIEYASYEYDMTIEVSYKGTDDALRDEDDLDKLKTQLEASLSSLNRVQKSGEEVISSTPSTFLSFENTYKVDEAIIHTQYTILKTIEGRNWHDDIDKYTFTVTAYDEVTQKAMSDDSVTFTNKTLEKSKENDYTYTAVIDKIDETGGQAKFELGDLDFKDEIFPTEEDGTTGTLTYKFKISEDKDSIPGMTYTDDYYILSVVLYESKENDGTIEKIELTTYFNGDQEENKVGEYPCTIYLDDNNKPLGSSTHNTAAHTFKFVNTYTAKASLKFNVTKTLEGREWYDNDKFSFSLSRAMSGSDITKSQDGDVSMTGTDLSISNKESDHKGSFNLITFNNKFESHYEGGQYLFTISETGSYGGITKPSEQKIYIRAVDNHDGTLKLLYKTQGMSEFKDLTKTGEYYELNLDFTNLFSENGTLPLNLKKIMQGRELVDGDQFTVDIITTEGTDPGNAEYEKAPTIGYNTEGGGTNVDIKFNKLKDVNKGDDYTFTLKEEEPSSDDKWYCVNGEYTINAHVERDIDSVTHLPTGKLNVTASYVTAGGSDTTDISGDTAEFSFTNQAYVNDSLTISKTFTGREWNDTDTFTVGITRTDDEGKDKVYIDDKAGASTTTAVEKGDTQSVTFTKVDHDDLTKYFTFLGEGTYKFTVKEQLPDGAAEDGLDNDITYDRTEYEWTVTVTDADGELTATSTLVKVKNIDGETPSEEDVAGKTAAFTNTYACRESVQVQKTFTGRSEKWTYKDTDEGEVYAEDERNDTFYFTVTPNNEATQNAVESKKITFDRERIELNGKDSLADKESGDTSVRTDSLKVLFRNLDFTEPDKEYIFEFLVEEVPDYDHNVPIPGVTYDKTKYTVTMTVTKNENNTYKVTSTYKKDDGTEADKITFHNKYEPTKASVKLSITKQLTGRQWTEGDRFRFNLTYGEANPTDADYDNNGKLLDENTLYKPFVYVMDSDLTTPDDDTKRTAEFYFQYSKPGTYTYTIKESIPGDEYKKGIKYDESTHTLVVVVKDDPDKGELHIESVTVDEKKLDTVIKTIARKGEFDAAPDEYKTDGLLFTNTYSANLNDIDNDDGACWIWVKKTIEGREWNGDKFKFIIEAEEDDTFTKEAIANKQLQFAEKDGTDFKERSSVSVGQDDDENKIDDEPDSFYRDSLRVQFVNVTFGEKDTNTYRFKIYEDTSKAAKDNGLTYDNAVRHVTVTVRDNKDGTLSITDFSVKDDKGDPVEVGTYPNKSHKDAEGASHEEYQLSFTNVYDAEGKWNFAIEKTIDGRPWNEDESFDFELKLTGTDDGEAMEDEDVDLPSDGKLTVENSEDTGEIYKISENYTVQFNHPGTRDYYFTLKEIKPVDVGENGLTYDEKVRTIVVSVEDDVKGGLSVTKVTVDGEEVTPPEPTAISFTNTYRVSTVWTPRVQKVLNGREWNTDDDFKFTLTPDTSDPTTQSAVDSGKIEAGGKPISVTSKAAVSLGDITIYSDGKATQTYKFKLTETNTGGGIIYSEDHIITLEVTDDREGKLSTKIISVVGATSGKRYDFATDPDTFTVTNTYSVTAELPENSIKITKEIEGREWLSGDTFKFTITAGNTTTQEAVDKGIITLPTGELIINNDSVGHSVGIGAISFNSTGEDSKTYTFTISEEKGDIKGLTYAKPQTVTVTVTDDLHGNITAKVDKSSLTFTNVYKAAGKLNADKIGVQSFLTGRVKDEWLVTDTFSDSFDYTIEGADESTKTAIADGNITFAGDSDSEKITVKSDTDEHKKGFGAISFSGIEFPTDEYGKESSVDYNFKVSQIDGKTAGIIYDKHYYTVTVTLTDNKDGSLDAKVTDVQKAEGAVSAASLDDYDPTALPFNNEYKATGTWSPDVNKLLTGRGWNSDTFTFGIKIADGEDYGDSVVMPEDKHIDVTESGLSDKFNAITFNKAGTYTFTVSESVPEDKKGIEYPEAQDITVTATDNTDGTLTISAGEDNTVEFTNEYSAHGSLASGSISVQKILEGREWQDYDKYVFSIAASEYSEDTQAAVSESDGRIKLPDAVTVSAEDLADGKYSDIFGEIEFNNIEFETDTAGKTLTKVFSFVMTEAGGDIGGVIYSDHKLYFNIVLEDNGDGTLKARLERDYNFEFTNEYKPKAASLDGFGVEKILEGRQWLSADIFYFDISGGDDETAKQLSSGDITVTGGTTASADRENKTARFGTLIFNNKGDYTFTVKERYGGDTLNGVTYDDSEWTISVSVTDDLLGQLWAKVTGISKGGEKADKIQFTNTYYAQTEYSIEAAKFIDGRDWNESDSFEFTLEPESSTADFVDAGRVIMPEDNTLTLDMNNQSGEFSPITFKSNGSPINLYLFRVSEKYAGETHNGLSYDTQYYVIVAVVDDLQGELHPVPISYARFINTYSAEGVLDGGKNLSVTKAFTGRPWIDTDSFTFTISGADDKTNAAIEEGLVTLPEDITIGYEDSEPYTKAFGDIGFKSDGSGALYYDYEFIVKEVYDKDSAVASVDYDTAERHIKVHVTDDQKGKLYAEIINNGEYSLTFTNTYHADSIKWPPVVSKILTGRDWVDEDSYKFTLSLDGEQPYGAKAEDVIISEPVLTITADSDAPDSATRTAQFGEIEFTQPGRYVFTISEQKDTVDLHGIEYSPRQYRVIVDVTDDTVGQLHQSVYNVLYTVDGGKTYTNYGYETFRFINHYGATGVWTPVVRKRLVGREWSEHDSFEFELTLDTERLPDGVSESDVMITSRNVTITKGEGESAAYSGGFGDVTFTRPGTYYFTIDELPQKIPNNGIYEATEPYLVAVHVTDEDNDGKLTVQPEIVLDGESAPYADVNSSTYRFVDVYSASGTWPPIISKSLAGRKWKDTDEFTFEIEALSWSMGDISESGVVLPEPLTVSNADLDENTVVGRFGAVEFHHPGVYTFAVREIKESIAGVNYDPTEYRITVEVDDDTYGGLTHEVIETVRNGVPLSDPDTVLFFTNRYSANGSLPDGKINVEKEIDGRDWIEGDSFAFNIDAADALTRRAVAAGLITLPDDAEIKYNKDEEHTGTFGDIGFKSSGSESVEYTFSVTENDDSELYPWMSFDAAVYTVKVAVKDNLDGTLSAEVTSVTKDDKDADIVFVNSYSAVGAWPPLVHKELAGRAWSRSDRFEFALTVEKLPDGVSESDIILPKDVMLYAPESGNISSGQFNDVKFTKPGEYQFKLSELSGNIAGVKYSDAEYIITVNVKDEGDGTLTPTVSSVAQSGAKAGEGTSDGGYKFINTYAVKTDGLKIAVNKNLIGRERLSTDTFTFKIAPADKLTEDAVSGGIIELPESVTASVKGEDTAAEFGGIVFNSTGEKESTYSFDITEIDTGIKGIEYSDKTENISVKVTDNLNGKITAAIVGAPKIEFTNTYTASGALSGEEYLKVAKTFIGREWLKDDKFEFAIKPADEYTEAAYQNGFISLPDDLVIGYNEQGVYTSNFDDIEFLSTGNKTEQYKFEISEVYDEHDAVFSTVYDTDKYTVAVTVTDEYDGTLSVTAEKPTLDGEAADVMTFTNTYTAEGIWPPIVGKTLVGRDWTDEDSFIFRLRLAGNQPEGTDRTAVKLPPVADIEITKSDLKDGVALKQFDETIFSQPGLYVFTLDEMRRTPERGIEYSDNFYTITVRAEHDGNAEGQMDVEIESVTLTVDAESVNYGNTDYFAFENVYSASGSWSAVIDKTLTGRGWLDSDKFTFDISVKAPEGVSPDSVKIRDDLYIIAEGENSDTYRKTFDDAVIFTKAGEYEVTVSERKLLEDNGITYDPTAKTVKVTVTDNGDGTLSVKSESNEFSFTNAYNAVGIWPPEVDKTLVGRPWSDGDSFAFNISLVDFPSGARLDMPENLVITKPLFGSGDTFSGAFDPVEFNMPGRYEFAVREVTDSHNGIQCDDTVYTIVVYVADDEAGTLVPGVTAVYRDGEQTDTESTLKFTNAYSAVGVLDGGEIRVEKELVGRQWLDDDVFTFTLTPNEDYGDKIELSGDTTEILGVYRDKYADFGEMTVYEAGEYVFTVKEENNAKGGITYDTTEHTVTLYAEDNGDGTLKLSVEGGDVKFINTYTPDPTTVVGEAQLPFNVELKGRQWQDGDKFTFTLSPAEEYGEKVQLGQTEVTVTGGGSAHFGDIVFREAGEYKFYVKQQPGTDSSITYDDRVYEVTVTVTDDLNGSLTATVDSVDMEFINVYIEPTTPPSDTTAPDQTTKPSDTTAPEQTTKPSDTTAPEQTTKPSDTTAPEQTTKPSDTTAPEQTTKPSDTTAPDGENPDTGVAPDVRSCVAAAAVTFGSAMALALRKRRKKK